MPYYVSLNLSSLFEPGQVLWRVERHREDAELRDDPARDEVVGGDVKGRVPDVDT